MHFRIKEKLILWISGSKKKSFSTQEVGKKIIFLSYLQNLHIVRNEKDDISVFKKRKNKIFSLAWSIVFTGY